MKIMCNSVTKGGNVYKNITNYLLSISVKPNTKGFVYLAEAVSIVKKHKGAKIRMFEDVYNKIGKKYDDNPLNVERALRYAIQTCKDKRLRTMTNGAFLATIKLENKIKGEN
jgi:hypothetical protein